MDVDGLLESWLLALRAERKSAHTLKTYAGGVRAYVGWCAEKNLPPELTRRQVGAWVADQLDGGSEATTARSRLTGVRRFSAWLAEEGELDADDLLGIRPPKLDEKVINPLNEDDIRALVAACKGNEFRDRRDDAVLRLMLETGLRAGEATHLHVSDVDLVAGIATVRRGKGFKGRKVSFGPQTARSIDRYLRARKTHPRAARPDLWPELWLGERGQGFGYSALWKQLQYRAGLAGIGPVNPHRLRHSFASRWLEAGGSEGGLMSQAGWARRDMLDRYSRSTAAARSAEEAKKLGLGDL